MFNGNGSPTTWQGVVAMGITLAYRLVALYILRDLVDGQKHLADLILKVGGSS
jgi:hypothetical protein